MGGTKMFQSQMCKEPDMGKLQKCKYGRWSISMEEVGGAIDVVKWEELR